MVRTICSNRVFLLLLKTFVSALLLLETSCSSIYYLPRVQLQKFYDPSQVGLHQEEVEFENQDGTRIHGWWFQSKTKEVKGTIIFFHGNAENITTHFLNLSWLPEHSYNYFIFDYPGYGVSEGKPTPYSTVTSGYAAIRWVHQHKDSGPLIIYGQSLGGAIAHRAVIDIKDEIPIKALILDSTFLSYRSLARNKAASTWITWLFQPLAWLSMSDEYAPQIERRAPLPLLVIHGQRDNVIPAKFGDEIFAKAPEPKQIWRIPEGQHGDVFWSHGKIYREKFLSYLEMLK